MNSWGQSREVEKVKRASQCSVASLPEHQQDAAMHAVDVAIERYPPVLVEGHLLHVFEAHGEWEVWVNTEDAAFTGLCVAVGPTRQAVITDAVRVLEAVTEALQGPPRDTGEHLAPNGKPIDGYPRQQA